MNLMRRKERVPHLAAASFRGRKPAMPALATGLLPCLLACLVSGLLAGCLADTENRAEEGLPLPEGTYAPPAPVLPEDWPAVVWPKDNPYTPAKALLGRDLFFEFDLSRDRTINCGWCHSPMAAFSDNHRGAFSTGVGHSLTDRNSPTLANVGLSQVLMFDGRETSLEAQALFPLFASNEMDMTGPEIEARLAADTAYVRLFRHAYGEGPITLEGVLKALATYQRTLVSHRAPYDRWEAGDEGALSPEAKRGAALFFGDKTDCRKCHAPPLFTDGRFHNNGLDSVPQDLGRAVVTGATGDAAKFKTPTLRNVELTGPYMHDGRFQTLAAVLQHYNAGGQMHANKDPLIRPLGLTPSEISDLTAFLHSLTDPSFLDSPWP